MGGREGGTKTWEGRVRRKHGRKETREGGKGT